MDKIRSILFLILFFGGSLIFTSDNFSLSLWLHSSKFSKNKAIAVKELKNNLAFYKKIGVENLYVYKTLKKEHGKGWNFLKVILKLAHKNGLKVHPVITPGEKIKLEGKVKKKPHWMIRDPFGKKLDYLNLSNPEVRKFILKKVKKMLRYKIDGIHLDYIRFPYLSQNDPGDSLISILIRFIRVALNYYIPDHIYYGISDNYYSYDKRTIKNFEDYFWKNHGESNIGGRYVLNEWRRWNASNVTSFVKEVKNLIKKGGDSIPLSAAIISNRDFALHSLGQDWSKWAALGIIDVLCPMIYSNDNWWVRERLTSVSNYVKGGCQLYAGIAISSSVNKNTPEGFISQIRIAREMNADGVVVFSGFSLTEKIGIKIKSELNEQN